MREEVPGSRSLRASVITGHIRAHTEGGSHTSERPTEEDIGLRWAILVPLRGGFDGLSERTALHPSSHSPFARLCRCVVQ
jgi:hypothetical protein